MVDSPTREPIKILVVDDDEEEIMLVRDAQEGAGYQVISTDNPVLVPLMIYKQRPALALIDVSMPLLDGESIIEVLDDSVHATKIVLHSGHKEDHLEELVQKCKVSGYIKKTPHPAELIAQVERFLKD